MGSHARCGELSRTKAAPTGRHTGERAAIRERFENETGVAVNYYERHMGDYSKDTRWITTYQHGVFALFLDWYYSNEKPIPLEIAYRIVSARSGPERRAVDEVLTSFFDLSKSPGFAHNKRADLDIAKYRLKCESNSLKAKGRWDATGMPPASDGHSVGNAEAMPSRHQTPDTRHQKIKSSPVVPKGDSPEEAVVDAYHRALPKCQRISVLNPKRRKRIAGASKLAKQICSDQGWEYTPAEFWEAYFAECGNDPWMRGEVPNPKNPRWVQNLDVLLAEDRFADVMDKAIAAMRRGDE